MAERETFGQVLRRLRDAADLSQMDLAVKAGLNLFTVAKLEQGQRDPSWATVQALAKALGVSCEEFVTVERPPAEAPPAEEGEAGKPKKGRKGKQK